MQCGAPKPPLTGPLADAEIIQIPIKTIFTSSTAQIPALVDVERVEVLTGHAQTSLVVSPLIVKRINEGKIESFAENYEIDIEAVIASNPRVLLSGGFEDPAYPALRDAAVSYTHLTLPTIYSV